jgi:hypothetical protein
LVLYLREGNVDLVKLEWHYVGQWHFMGFEIKGKSKDRLIAAGKVLITLAEKTKRLDDPYELVIWLINGLKIDRMAWDPKKEEYVIWKAHLKHTYDLIDDRYNIAQLTGIS